MTTIQDAADEREKLAGRIETGLASDSDGHFAPPLHTNEWRLIAATLRAPVSVEGDALANEFGGYVKDAMFVGFVTLPASLATRIATALRIPAPADGEALRSASAQRRQETQETICAWTEATFGTTSSNARVASRANEEMAELLRALTSDDNHPKAIEEAADVVIILYRLAHRMGADLHAEIDRKMEINRKREWKVTNGHGYHVRNKGASTLPSTPGHAAGKTDGGAS